MAVVKNRLAGSKPTPTKIHTARETQVNNAKEIVAALMDDGADDEQRRTALAALLTEHFDTQRRIADALEKICARLPPL